MASLPRYKLYGATWLVYFFFATLCLFYPPIYDFFSFFKSTEIWIYGEQMHCLCKAAPPLLKILSKKYSTKSDWKLRIDLVRAWIEGQFHMRQHAQKSLPISKKSASKELISNGAWICWMHLKKLWIIFIFYRLPSIESSHLKKTPLLNNKGSWRLLP